MNRHRKLNGALAAAVLLLAGVVWILEIRRENSGTKPLIDADKSRVAEITIARPGRETITLSRRDAGWHMVNPYDLPANDLWMGRLLALLSTKSVKRLDSPGGKRDGFGLDPPRMLITVDSARLSIGDRHPYNLQRYVEADDGLHLTEDRFSRILGAPATHLVSPRLIPPDSQIRFIETPEWKLLHDGQGDWRMEPADKTASGDRFTAKIASWETAEATEVYPSDESMEGAPLRIGLEGLDRVLEFRVSDRKNRLKLTRPDVGLAYEIPQLERLLDYPRLPEKK